MYNNKMKSPFRHGHTAHLTALALTCASAFINVGLGFNAIVKANQLGNIPPTIAPLIAFSEHDGGAPIGIDVNTQDIVHSGAAVIVISAFIVLLCTLMIFFHLRGPLSSSALSRQGAALALCGALLFAAMIPYTLFYRSRSAKVAVSLFSIRIPEDIVQAIQDNLGIQSKYSQIGFLRLMAILPWFTVIISLITAGMLLFVV